MEGMGRLRTGEAVRGACIEQPGEPEGVQLKPKTPGLTAGSRRRLGSKADR